jgi:hypothetical protein
MSQCLTGANTGRIASKRMRALTGAGSLISRIEGLLNRISEANSDGRCYNANFGIKDAQFVIAFAKLLYELCER